MRIYVATKFTNYRRAARIAKCLEEAGHVITHKWWATDEFDETGEPIDLSLNGGKGLSAKSQQTYAAADFHGVRSADCIFLLADAEIYGALIEFGIALATLTCPHRIVVAPRRHSIFFAFDGVVVVDTVDEGIEELKKMAPYIRQLPATRRSIA